MPLSTLTVAMGLVDSLLAPVALRPVQFVSLLLIGAFIGSFAAMLKRSVTEDRGLDTKEAVLEAGRNAAVGAVWAIAAGVLVFTLGGYGWAVIVASLFAYPLLRWVLRRVRHAAPARPGEEASAEGMHPQLSTPPFEKCSTSELTAAWGASYELLQAASSPRVKARIAALRGAYLDELERRDRLGVKRWLSSGADPASDARHYFRHHDGGGEKSPGVS